MSNHFSLQAALDHYLSVGRSYWAPRTQAYYEKMLGYFVQYVENELHLAPDQADAGSLPEDVLVQYAIWLRSRSRFSSHPQYEYMRVSGTIKSNTVVSYMRAVKAFFNYLYEHGMVSIRYTEGLKLPRPDRQQIVPLTDSEVAVIDAVFDATTPIDLRNLCIFHLMIDAGLRSCEVLALQTKDLMFASNVIIVNVSKGNKSRAVVMCPKLKLFLMDYVERFRPAGTLFRTNHGNPITSAVLRSLFLRIRRQTGIERVHPHLLRHTFATSYLVGGGNLETLRILLGHYDYTVTRQYLHFAGQYQILHFPIYRLDDVFFKRGY